MKKLMSLTVGEIFDRFNVEGINACGLSEWCLNEGMARRDDKHYITFEQAQKAGITESEFNNRAGNSY